MDEQNQMQNPDISSSAGGMDSVNPAPMPVMPPMPSMQDVPSKSKSIWLWVVILGALIVAGVAWWYISQMAVEPLVQQEPAINQEARTDILINKEIQGAGAANIDSEFKAIDADINSL